MILDWFMRIVEYYKDDEYWGIFGHEEQGIDEILKLAKTLLGEDLIKNLNFSEKPIETLKNKINEHYSDEL